MIDGEAEVREGDNALFCSMIAEEIFSFAKVGFLAEENFLIC